MESIVTNDSIDLNVMMNLIILDTNKFIKMFESTS